MYDTIIIGGGPAGLTAAIYALRKRINVLMISGDLGGKTNHKLELKDMEHHQLIQGVEIVSKFRRELEYLNFAHLMDDVQKLEKKDDFFVVSTKMGKTLKSKTIIIATGARQKFLNVPGEKDFLGRGLGYSVMSYAPLMIDKEAIVVGNGSLAFRSAAELATVASHVHLVCEQDDGHINSLVGNKLKAAKNVTLMKNHRVTEVIGNGFCLGVRLVNEAGEEIEVKAECTFVEKALIPNSEIVAHLVELDHRGRIVVDNKGRTDVAGLFAAGDVTTTTEQVLVAIGEGAKAALSAYDYLLPSLEI